MQHMFAKTDIGYVIYTLQPILPVKNCRSKINVEKDTTN